MSIKFEKGGVAWGVKPPSGNKPRVPLVQPEPGKYVEIVVVDEEMTSVILHWFPDGLGGGRSLPCSGDREKCPGCKANLPSRWKGYLAGMHRDTRVPCIAVLTPSALDSCPVLAKPHIQLRGGVLKLERKGSRRNSPVIASFTSACPWAASYLIRLDTKECLLRIWAGEKGENASVARRAGFEEGEVAND